MDGVVAQHEHHHLENRFTDRMDVSVDFRAEPLEGGRSRLIHTITINSKGMGKVFTPRITRQLPEQTRGAMTNLKALAGPADRLPRTGARLAWLVRFSRFRAF